jgi:hypothetical protein
MEEISNRETLDDYKTPENNQENGETQEDLDEYIKGGQYYTNKTILISYFIGINYKVK